MCVNMLLIVKLAYGGYFMNKKLYLFLLLLIAVPFIGDLFIHSESTATIINIIALAVLLILVIYFRIAFRGIDHRKNAE